MKLGGLQKMTLIDYPGKIACAVFTQGCNFRCGFCHNGDLIRSSSRQLADELQEGVSELENSFFDFLKEQKDFLDGVCVSGGEPTLQPDLIDFLSKIKKMGFAIKLDTNGSLPEPLKKILELGLVDYVAMDIKAPIRIGAKHEARRPWRASPLAGNTKSETKPENQNSKYKTVVGAEINLEKIKESVELIKNSGVDYEFRTTVVPGLHTKEDILEIGEWLDGSKKYYLQQFRPETVFDKKYSNIKPYPDEILADLCNAIKHHFEVCEVRE